MKPRRAKGLVSPGTLKEVYAYRGDYSVKMLIDSEMSQKIETVEISLRNSDGQAMSFSAKRWGTKININFKIDDGTPDGVSVIDVVMAGRSGSFKERFGFWIVKD